MMKCREYIFKLTSGQLDHANGFERFLALQHRMMCSRCRAFAHNDACLNQMLKYYRERVLTPAPQQPTE